MIAATIVTLAVEEGADKVIPWLPFIATVLLIIGNGVFMILNRRGGEAAKRRDQAPPTWPEIWARMDAIEERTNQKFGAMGRMLASAAEQWPHDRPGPVFDTRDIEILEDTIPVPEKWRRPRPAH